LRGLPDHDEWALLKVWCLFHVRLPRVHAEKQLERVAFKFDMTNVTGNFSMSTGNRGYG
jgi:hypothetical protein